MYKRNIAIIFLLLIMVVSSCGKGKETQSKYAQVELQKEKVASELAKKHNAVTDWDKDKILYTIQLQRLFLDDRPVLAIGYVDDIYQKDDQFYVRLNSTSIQGLKTYGSMIIEPEINFILRCDSVKVSKIFSDLQGSSFPEFDPPMYAFVAFISNVTKPVLRIDDSVAGDTVEWSYKPPKTFIAEGDCIDLIYMGTFLK